MYRFDTVPYYTYRLMKMLQSANFELKSRSANCFHGITYTAIL